MSDYHKLEVWKLACILSDRVTEMVDLLGSRIRASKADQVTRSADSIHENIAEGCGYGTDAQLAKFCRQALGSADEVQDQLETFERRRLILPGYENLLPHTITLCKKLSTLVDTLDPPSGGRRRPK